MQQFCQGMEKRGISPRIHSEEEKLPDDHQKRGGLRAREKVVRRIVNRTWTGDEWGRIWEKKKSGHRPKKI